MVVLEDSTLRSIPTDAADSQQSRSLPAGEITSVSAEFLGWRRIDLDSGETGWVRKSALLPVYSWPTQSAIEGP